MEQILKTPPNPCYDVKTRTLCPNRHVGCHDACEKWAEYVKARNEVYAKRKAAFDASDAAFIRKHEKEKKRLRRQISDRICKRK